MVTLTVIMLGVVVHRSMQPDWVLLYGGLEPEVAASVVDELNNEKIKYVREEGTAIMVERKDLYELRIKLASKGLPGNGGIRFEIFDHQSLPGTAFSNTVNLQRALKESCRDRSTAWTRLLPPGSTWYCRRTTVRQRARRPLGCGDPGPGSTCQGQIRLTIWSHTQWRGWSQAR